MGFGVAMGVLLGGQGSSEEAPLEFVTTVNGDTTRSAPVRFHENPSARMSSSGSTVSPASPRAEVELPSERVTSRPAGLVDRPDGALESRRRSLGDKTRQFDLFEGSMTRMLGNPELALDAWELNVELKSMLRQSQENNTPLPSEGEILNRIRERLGTEAFETMQSIFSRAPIGNEAEFTRYLYRYRRTDENGKQKPLVLKSVNELAIWFLPRDTARQWGYIR